MAEETRQDDLRRRSVIRLSLSLRDLELLDRASACHNKTRSEFILDASREAAEAVMSDRHAFRSDAARSRSLMDIFDAEPRQTERLRRLIVSRAPWDEQQ